MHTWTQPETNKIPQVSQVSQVTNPTTTLYITRPVPDTNMSHLANLKSSLRNRTRAMETLLGRITIPIQNLAEEMECTGYIKRINEMDFEANSNFLDIESEHKNNIDATELAAFKASLASIQTRTSSSNAALYACKVTNIPVSQLPSKPAHHKTSSQMTTEPPKPTKPTYKKRQETKQSPTISAS